MLTCMTLMTVNAFPYYVRPMVFISLKYRIYGHYPCGLVIIDGDCLAVQVLIASRSRYHVPSPLVTLPFISNSALINGRGRYPHGPSSPLSVVHVKAGKRYRFRLVGMSCDSDFRFSIDGHNMTIIEADGVNTRPLLVDSIRIFAGQRYSFVVDANKNTGNFWIRAEQHSGGDGGPTGFANGINSAILRYAGSPDVDPTTHHTKSVIPLEETNLHPLENPGAPGLPHAGGADVVLNLKLGMTKNSTKFTMNGAEFIPPSVPVLLQILSGTRNAKHLLPKGSVYTLPPNKVIEVSIPPHGALGGPVRILSYVSIDCADCRVFSILSTFME
jgi:iron transport multicopper oxidase